MQKVIFYVFICLFIFLLDERPLREIKFLYMFISLSHRVAYCVLLLEKPCVIYVKDTPIVKNSIVALYIRIMEDSSLVTITSIC